MKKVDSGEFYSARQENIFSEYKPFRAEEYASPEFAGTPEEVPSYRESYQNDGVKPTAKEGTESVDAKEVQKQYDKISRSHSTETGEVSATSSGAGSSGTASASQAANAVSSSAATAAGSASAGATVVMAAVIALAAITGGVGLDYDRCVQNEVGMDYIAITVDMDEILSQADENYGLSAEDFAIELPKGASPSRVALSDGKHSYLITGLQPENTYTYRLICNNPSFEGEDSRYLQTFTTLSCGEPKGVYDERNNYITYDEVSQTASVFYSVYLSDYENQYADTALYLCSGEQTDFSDIQEIEYYDDAPDEDRFFQGRVDGIICNALYLYLVGKKKTAYGEEAVLLFSRSLAVDIPEEWITARNPAFVVDESAEVLENAPDKISVSGAVSAKNALYEYSATVTQYNGDGTALIEKQEVSFTVDDEKGTYAFVCGAYYGVETYRYTVYAEDENGTRTTVYESAEKTFTASQEYGASYTKVEPENAAIAYGAEGVTVTVDTGFTSAYENYSYRLTVTNGAGEAYGAYAGRGVAVITIADYAGLDEIYFTYTDLGEFAGGEREYAAHATAGIPGKAYFFADESAEVLEIAPDTISVSGAVSAKNALYEYSATVTQFNGDGTALAEKQEVSFTVDDEKGTYAFACGAYYGVETYRYTVYAEDENGTRTTVYESAEKTFTASQEYGASYTKVEPENAAIAYDANGVTVTVDTGFTSAYENYSYRLTVTNGAGEAYGAYAGRGVAVITIADYAGLDEICFTYSDFGVFEDGEREYATHATEGVAFCVPAVSLGADCAFNGQYFTLSYVCDMIYDYASASMEIEVSDGNNVFIKQVDVVAASGTIVLDTVEGEIGDVTVTGTLYFKDNQADGATHSVGIDRAEYALYYSFEVTKVEADISDDLVEVLPVTLYFDYTLPEDYRIKITDEANSVDFSIDLTGKHAFSDLSAGADANLTIQATDAGGNAWGAPQTVNISKSAAKAEYVAPTMSSPNPGDAVVTYNEDGTINIYREMIPSAFGRDTISDDERVSYNAFVQGYYTNEDGLVYTDGYDVIGRGKYAAIENIPNQNYIFVYYTTFDYNGVSYVMSAETPSGSVENVYDCATAMVTYGDGNTTISVTVTAYGQIGNTIIVNGVAYEYDFYPDESATDLTLVIEGETEVGEVTIFFTKQGYNYDAYGASGEITMKGNKYGLHVITMKT